MEYAVLSLPSASELRLRRRRIAALR